MLLAVFSQIGRGSATFVDIGAGDGLRNSNCANLALNHGWSGLFIEADGEQVARGESFYDSHPDTFLYPPEFVRARATRENIDDLVTGAGSVGRVDLLSIDIDGNDYWIWDALTAVRPRVVIIETTIEFGLRNIVMPYDPGQEYPGAHPDYHGASVVALAKLASAKGYRLVGANRYGFNTIYVSIDEPDLDRLPALAPEDVLAHPRNRARSHRYEEMSHLPFVEGGTGFPGEPVG